MTLNHALIPLVSRDKVADSEGGMGIKKLKTIIWLF